MQQNRYISNFLLVFSLFLIAGSSNAQLGFSFDIPKPKQYEERQLRSEKSEQKKFTLPGRFIQNTTTHYNYFFNANNKMNEIVDRAKAVHRDDFTQLLSFYNYDLDETASDSLQLDSLIYKATTGIVLHDLRSDWADNMYLLWGAAITCKNNLIRPILLSSLLTMLLRQRKKMAIINTLAAGWMAIVRSPFQQKKKIASLKKYLRGLPAAMMHLCGRSGRFLRGSIILQQPP